MKNILSLIALLFSAISFSQEETDLPNFTPPSPEAAAITQYGNQTINESTGKAATSIPIYNYSAGQVQVPITMSYIGNGVKLDDNNTWTGVNWTLNTGGVITRTVYHNPDEISTTRIFQDDIDDLGLVNADEDAEDLYSFYGQGITFDTQPDIFTFSFSGYSGSFYLRDNNSYQYSTNPIDNTLNPDNDLKPILINVESNLKIEILGTNSDNRSNLAQNNEFKITTPDGVQYFFGGQAIEETQMEQDWHNVVTPRAVTSYYLTEIRHPINGIVYFEYNNVTFYRIATSQSKTISRYVPDNNLGFYDGCGIPPECEPVESSNEANYGSTLLINRVYNGKFLSRIYSSNNSKEVLFNTSNPDTDGGMNLEKVLNSIELKDNSNLINKIDFSYLFDVENNKTQRFILDRIDFDKDLDGNGISDDHNHKKYKFKYNDFLGLPARFSSSQDALGYYNGKVNANGLLPDSSTLTMGYGSPGVVLGGLGIATADRSTDLNYKIKGTLEKIYYPTGGHTLFEYEPILAKESAFLNQTRKVFINNYPIPGGNGATQNDVPSNSVHIGIIQEIDENGNPITNSLFESQMITINVELETTDQIGHQVTNLKITNITDNIIEDNPIVMPNEGGFNPSFIETRSFERYFDKNKDYKVELILPAAPTPIPSSIAMRGILSLSYQTGYNLVDGEGLRIKRVSDFINNASTNPNNIKRYYYTNIENVFNNPIDYVDIYKKPIFHEEVSLLKKCNAWQSSNSYCDIAGAQKIYFKVPYTGSMDSHRGYTLSINPINYNPQVINNYKNITISYGGDNFENGAIEKIFVKDVGNVVMEVHPPRIHTRAYQGIVKAHSGAGWLHLLHGRQEKEKVFKKRNDTLFKVNQKDYEFFKKNLTYQQVSPGTIFNDYGPGFLFPYENAGIGMYQIYSKEIAIEYNQETNYIDAVPIAWPGNTNVPTNPYTTQGWMPQDHDNDGITNYYDEDYQLLIDNWDPSEALDESNYRKIITTTEYKYDSDYAGQPTKVITTTSDDSRTYESVNRYLDESEAIVNSDPNLNATDLSYYDSLRTANRINSPIQTESYLNLNGNLTLLSKNRTTYKNTQGHILPSKINTAKGSNDLEERVEFVSYSASGNPTEVKKTDGSITRYTYNGLNLVVSKIENYQTPSVSVDPNQTNTQSLCNIIQSAYPNSQVSYYYYDDVTNPNLLTKIFNANCQTIYYEYDEQYRLKYVKDKDGNILSKNEYNYTTQN